MKKRMTVAQLKNLKQYSDAKIDAVDKIIHNITVNNQDEQRIIDYISKMSEQYDVLEMNENDSTALKDLATISIRVQDLDQVLRIKMSDKEGIDWSEIHWITDILTDLRKSRQQIEESLNITRRARQGVEQTSVVDAIESYKLRAKKLLEERLNYIYCPKCKLLIGNVWMLNPYIGNSFTFTCPRELEDKQICGHKFSVTGSELMAKKNKNVKEMLET